MSNANTRQEIRIRLRNNSVVRCVLVRCGTVWLGIIWYDVLWDDDDVVWYGRWQCDEALYNYST
jgi:hypothetical protein